MAREVLTKEVGEMKKTKNLGTPQCLFRRQAGSYYDYLPWDTCSKKPSRASNENEMCDLDMGRDCTLLRKETK